VRGIGNLILRDEGIGVHAVRELEKRSPQVIEAVLTELKAL
jgi:Ni,Fe-hydrogenase maturation factor